MPSRAQNMRRLHALGRRARRDHDALRDFAGVASLADLTDRQLEDACVRLQRELPDRPYKRRRASRAAPGTVKTPTAGQRRAIESRILDGLTAHRFGLEFVGTLLQRHLPGACEAALLRTDLTLPDWRHAVTRGVYSRAAASALITQLDQITRHRAPGWRSRRGAAHAEVPSV